MADAAQSHEQRFDRCRELIARQRVNLDERLAMTKASDRWCQLTHEFADMQTEINRLLGAAG